jgi:hypothetical protein
MSGPEPGLFWGKAKNRFAIEAGSEPALEPPWWKRGIYEVEYFGAFSPYSALVDVWNCLDVVSPS